MAPPLFFSFLPIVGDRRRRGEQKKRSPAPNAHACMWDCVCVRNTRARTLRCLIDWGWQTGQSQTPTRFPASTRYRPKIFTHDKGQETGKSATILFLQILPSPASLFLSTALIFLEFCLTFEFIDIRASSQQSRIRENLPH